MPDPDRTTRTPSSVRIPGWVPPVLYGALAVFLFREFVLTDRMLFGDDTLGAGYVARELYAEALRSLGRVPEWAPHILGGTPFLEALSGGDSLYPPSLLLLVITDTYRALGWKLVLHVFAAGLFFFGWVRAIGGSRAAALLGGTAYMLAPFLIGFVHPGHDGKIFVTALAPLLFWATERHFDRPGPESVAGVGLVVALVMFTTHFQMAYFLFGGVGLYAIFRAVQIGRSVDEVVEGGGSSSAPARGGLRFALFLVASLLGAAGAAYQFVPAADYVTEHSRRIQTTRAAAGETGRAWSSSYSMHPEEAMSLLVPEFMGNAAGGPRWAEGTYWGRNGFRDNHQYAGLVVLLLAAASFVGARRKQLRWFLVFLGLLAFGFAMGTHTPVWGIFYAVVPGIRLFRAPDMVMFLFGFSAITLASLGLDRILGLAQAGVKSGTGNETAKAERRGEGKGRKKGSDDEPERSASTVRKVVWGATGAMALLALLMGSGALMGFWTTVVYPSISERQLQILQAHAPSITQGASAAVLLALTTSALVWAILSRRLAPGLGLAALVVLVAVDAARIDRAFIETVDFHAWSTPDPNVRALLERESDDGSPYRLASYADRGQDVTPAMHGIELASGHHPNDLSRYRELIGMVGSGYPEHLGNANVQRLLNVEYILWPDIELGSVSQGPGPVVSRTQVAGGRPYHTLYAVEALPRARLVSEYVVRGDEEAVEYIMSARHDPAVEAVLPAEPSTGLGGGVPEGAVRWVERAADRMTLQVEADRAALLIVADNWFPAWRASVDGQETEVLRAYHTLRAVPVPAGTSTVEMWYESELLELSRWVSLLVLLGLMVMGGWALIGRRTRGEDST